nr:hypothetical protein [Tanacetum cinerariifolium]
MTVDNVTFQINNVVLGENYSSTEQVNSIQQFLAYCLINGTKVDIGEIIYSDLVTKIFNKSRLKYVSYPRFISCALQVLLGSDYTHDENFRFLSGILNLERNIQLASTGLPSTLDEGTRKSQPFPESTYIDPKDSVGNKQPIDTRLLFTTSDEGTVKTTPPPKGSLRNKDSRGNIPPDDMEPIHPTVADLLGTSAKYQYTMKDLQAHALKQEEESAAWIKSSTNMAWNLRKGIATKSDKDPSKKLPHASTIVHPDPNEEVKVPYTINGKMCYLTDTEMKKEEAYRIGTRELKYGIFFMDVFGDEAFQRWNDIHKVGVDYLVSYMVMASMVKTEENLRFFLKLRKLTNDHPDQKKLKSKRVKLEALGYQID